MSREGIGSTPERAREPVRPHQPGQADFRAIFPEEIEWQPFAAFPPLARLAIIVGEPVREGPYTIRVKLPHGTKMMPHSHPEDRMYTVTSGIFYIGLGGNFEPRSYRPTRRAVLSFYLVTRPTFTGQSPESTSRRLLRLGRLALNRPQTLYALADSPIGLAAWVLDHDGTSMALMSRVFDGQSEGLTRDDVLDNITYYWFTNTAVSSARLYWESKLAFFAPKGVAVPTAVSAFPDELYQAPKSWTEKAYAKLIYYHKLDKGGHFAAWQQPKLFTQELRAAFKSLR